MVPVSEKEKWKLFRSCCKPVYVDFSGAYSILGFWHIGTKKQTNPDLSITSQQHTPLPIPVHSSPPFCLPLLTRSPSAGRGQAGWERVGCGWVPACWCARQFLDCVKTFLSVGTTTLVPVLCSSYGFSETFRNFRPLRFTWICVYLAD